MKKVVLPLLFLFAATSIFMMPGCSKDDTTVDPNNPDNSKIDIQLVPNSKYVYDRTDLDSNSAAVSGTTRDYTINIKGNGNLLLGAYSDWFYRVGTDAVTLKKDTLYIRVEDGTNFTKTVQVYGFQREVLKRFVALITSQFPNVTPPVIPGEQWDIIAMFHDNDGKAYDVGKTWTIGNANGLDLSFDLGLPAPITINVAFKGKFESKGVKMMVGTKEVTTWSSSVTIVVNLLGSVTNLKSTFWFSDDPDMQVKVVQESAKIVIPFVGLSFPIPGEMQMMKSYQQ